MTYMLDTNICIYAMKRNPIEVYSKLIEHTQSGVCISAVTLAELKFGVYKSNAGEKRIKDLTNFLIEIPNIPFDEEAAVEYGKIRVYLERAGTPIGPMDMLIAAHAKSLGYTLVTNNVREFERVPDLKIENWVG